MEATVLDPTGVKISRLGFGCAGLMRVTSSRDRMLLLATALDTGISHFDVARMYGLGAAEGEVGRFVRGQRERVTITTKFGLLVSPVTSRLGRFQQPARSLVNRYPALRRAVRRGAARAQPEHQYNAVVARSSLERSLRELCTDYVDLYLLHEPPSASALALDDLCAYLESARDAGYIRAWGFAGQRASCAELQAAIPEPTVVQFHDDIFSPEYTTGSSDSTPAIVFGVIAAALQRILAHIDDAARCRHWTQALKVNAADPSFMASLLIRDALARRPRDVVLFSTSKPAHITETVPRAIHDIPTASDPVLSRFRDLVRTELPLPPPVET
jgi:D-threo-aldose 1-dehydrogenase